MGSAVWCGAVRDGGRGACVGRRGAFVGGDGVRSGAEGEGVRWGGKLDLCVRGFGGGWLASEDLGRHLWGKYCRAIYAYLCCAVLSIDAVLCYAIPSLPKHTEL